MSFSHENNILSFSRKDGFSPKWLNRGLLNNWENTFLGFTRSEVYPNAKVNKLNEILDYFYGWKWIKFSVGILLYLFRQSAVNTILSLNLFCSWGDFDLLIFLLPASKCCNHKCVLPCQAYVVLVIEPRASSMLEKCLPIYSDRWPAPLGFYNLNVHWEFNVNIRNVLGFYLVVAFAKTKFCLRTFHLKAWCGGACSEFKGKKVQVLNSQFPNSDVNIFGVGVSGGN